MKQFYQWYRKHITGAIFTGLILGLLVGLFLANKSLRKESKVVQTKKQY